jgi:hypothetical protein
MSFVMEAPRGESLEAEFRGDIFNDSNCAPSYSAGGNLTYHSSTFGQVVHVHDHRLAQRSSLNFRF